MLTVYSAQGSPGASTTAMHLAAHWAAEGREVLLIEADPAGGSLSHNLGIQFTPGSASFVASGLPILSNHLIDHAQDVLFENLHVMPAPASPAGARGIFQTFAGFSEDLRAISENEMAVIIDGGRITADTAASALTTGAAGVVVVCRDSSQLSSLEHLTGALAAGTGDGPVGCVVTVGKSPKSPEEWQEDCGLTFSGSIEMVSNMATDLSAYLARSKRKSKKWRASLEEVGEKLYAYAQPPPSGASHRSRSAAPAPTAPAPDPSVYGQPQPAPYEPPPGSWTPAAPAAGYGPSHYPPPAAEPQPGYGPSHYPPPAPAEGYPGYGHDQYPAPYEQAPAHPQPPAPYEPAPPHYEQAYGHDQYPAPYEQAPAHPQPPAPYEPAPPHYEQAYGHDQYPAPYEQAPQPPVEQPVPGAPEPPPRPELQATGSFRDWAVTLHGSDAKDVTARRGG